MSPSKHKSIKSLYSIEDMKKVGKTISKFFLFNAIPFNAVDNGPYYQSTIDTIAEAGPSIKGPTGYQIGNTYLKEKVQKLKVYITTLKLNGLYMGAQSCVMVGALRLESLSSIS